MGDKPLFDTRPFPLISKKYVPGSRPFPKFFDLKRLNRSILGKKPIEDRIRSETSWPYNFFHAE